MKKFLIISSFLFLSFLLGSSASVCAGIQKFETNSEIEKADNTFWDDFEKTFIREDRWKLFATGILKTLQISALSILFGTITGFALYMFERNRGIRSERIIMKIVAIINGIPNMVFLMLLFYVFFGKSGIDGVWISIIGFSILFGINVYSMLKNGIAAVDPGQREGAIALGYPESALFFRVILPQAVNFVFPLYQDAVITLIKETSIVGYVAVQDLTKITDIVRGRTYQAFFPIIATAVLYFVLSAFLTFIIQQIGDSMNPEKRNKTSILKGIRLEALHE